MSEGDVDRKSTTRWWLNPALARLAFGDATQATHATRSTFPPAAILEIDLSDPAQREFGDYELIDVAGRGGMGVVYRARQRDLDREVALKLLSAGDWADEKFVEGFRREARNAALLQHPNIVVVHEMGEHAGLIYYAMQLVRGRSLSQRLDHDGPLPPREAARMLRTIAEAVDYAHRLGVLHLDLKPGNILINEGGEPLVADFGLARRLEQALVNDSIAGTPSYMAPEQAQVNGPALSPATDVWGLGAVLYEMLTGHPPFEAKDTADVLRLLHDGEIRRPSRYARIPAELEAICLHCLQREPTRRYASARELADDLGRFLEGRAVSVLPLNVFQRVGRWMRRDPRLATAAGSAVLLLVAGLLATTQQWRRAEGNADEARRQLWSQRSDKAWSSIGEGGLLDALAPLAQNLIEQEAAGAHDATAISRARIGSLLARSPALIGVFDAHAPIFTLALADDGSWVAAGSDDGAVRLIEVPSGRVRWTTQTRNATHFMVQALHVGELWKATDGRHLLGARPAPDEAAYPSGANQLLFDLQTGALWTPADPDFRDATFSPDGGFALIRTNGLRTRLVHVPDGRPVSPWRSFDAGNPLWLLAPLGRHVAAATGGGGRKIELWAPETLQARFKFEFEEARMVRSWIFTPDARYLVLGHRDGQISLVDTRSGVLTPLQPQRPASVGWMRISRDGAWLAASYEDGHALVWDLQRRELLSEPVPLGSGVFSVEVDNASRTLFSRDQLEAEVWRIPETPGPALRLYRRPGLPTTRYGRSNAWAPQSGLLAAGTLTGEIRVWRTHQEQPLPWLGPPQPSETAFDGRHVVAADGNHVRVMDALSRHAAGPRIDLPQPVGFALLLGDGRTLVASAGRALHVLDWQRGMARMAPIVLQNSPVRLLATPDGAVLITSEIIRSGNRSRARIASYGIKDGKRLGSIELDAPLHGMRLSSDGRDLLAWHFGELHVFDARTLVRQRSMQRFGPDQLAARRALYASNGPIEVTDPDAFWGKQIMDADVDRAGGLVWVLLGEYELKCVRYADGMMVREQKVPVGHASRVEAATKGAFVLSEDQGLLRFNASNGLRSLARSADNVEIGVLARSGDGRRLAISTGHGAMLFDAASGQWLTPPLQLIDDPQDPPLQLALDQHGETLLVQSLARRFVVRLASEERAPTDVVRLASLWRPVDALNPVSPTVAGPAAGLDPHQVDPGVTSMAPFPAPTRSQTTLRPSEPRFVDLRPHCNFRTDGNFEFLDERILSRSLPRGRQTLLGHDFWIDCGVAASLASLNAPYPERVDDIAIGMRRFAALDVLLTGRTTTPGFAAVPYALIELHYRDGSVAKLPIHSRSEVWAFWHDGTDLPEQPLAYLSQLAYTTGYVARLYAVHLENPHPEREVQSLALAATDYAWSSPLVLAVTLGNGVAGGASPPGLATSRTGAR
ncbi:hypothetical protein GCM10027431_18980 [Lysobacter rhizosphaerae]